MKIKIISLMFGILLLTSLVMAKDLSSVDKLNWKESILTIKSDGVYSDDIKIKEKEKAEIWIDKKQVLKDSVTYYVDSLIIEDTKVEIELFYDIQPDTIYYKSETGKYEGYVNWKWKDKTDCAEEEYCGGYAVIEATLEYAIGSNTFTSAISGATWQSDEGSTSLTVTTDYTLSGSTFTIVNSNLSWVGIDTSYNYATLGEVKTSINKTIVGQGSFADYFDLIALALVISVIIGLIIMFAVPRNVR